MPMAKYENSSEPRSSGKWFIDSGCSNHMTYDKSLFSSYIAGNHSSVELGNNNTASVCGKGTVELPIVVSGKQIKCRLTNVLHVPELGYQLISVPTLDKSGLKTSFHSRRCWIEKDSKLIATGTISSNLYKLDTSDVPENKALVAADMRLWHNRLAHVHPYVISNMADAEVATGLALPKSSSDEFKCVGCVLGKGHRTPIPKKVTKKTSQLLETSTRMSMDRWKSRLKEVHDTS